MSGQSAADEDAVELEKGLLSAALNRVDDDYQNADELHEALARPSQSAEDDGEPAPPESLLQMIRRVCHEYSVTIGWIVMSVISSVAIILANKEVFALGFKFPLTLTTAHFIVQALMLESFVCMGTLEKKELPLAARAAAVALNVASISLMNVSLNVNTVCVYQISKMLIIPLAAAIQYKIKGTKLSGPVMMALGLVLVGVAVTNITEVGGTLAGTAVGVLAAVLTAGCQVAFGYFANTYELSSPQILQCVSVPQVIVQTLVAYFVEVQGVLDPSDVDGERPSPLSFRFTHSFFFFSTLSCLLAVSVNVATAGLIKHTSSVTYQVVGHAKTTLLLLVSFLVFPISAAATDLIKQLLGVATTMIGVIWYGILKDREKSAVKTSS